MTPLLAEISSDLVSLIAGGGGLLLGFMGMVFWFTFRAQRVKEREQTTRELAAYVAEGSMTTDEAERILRACGSDDD